MKITYGKLALRYRPENNRGDVSSADIFKSMPIAWETGVDVKDAKISPCSHV